jgi:CBS-domain-containing membrane protein
MKLTWAMLNPLLLGRRPARRRSSWSGEVLLILLPTLTVLAVMATVHALTQQRLLFASLASSAFLIYLDPLHDTNSVRTLVLAQLGAATLGLIAYLVLDSGYTAAALAMVAAIALMVAANAVHPPAVATALSFALRAGDESNLVLFGLAVGITAVLIVLERATLWISRRFPA